MTTSTYVGGRRRLASRACLIFAGLLAGSALSLLGAPAFASDVIPPHVYSMSPTGVNVSDGTFVYKETDLSIGTLQLERFHSYTQNNPNDPARMFNGLHASNNFDIYVKPNFVPAVYQDVDNPDFGDDGDSEPKKVMLFPQHYRPIIHMGLTGSGEYTQDKFTDPVTVSANSEEAQHGVLSYANGAYTYVDQSSVVYTFNQAPSPDVAVQIVHRIASIKFPTGLVRTFSYNAAGQLKMVSDNSGYAIVFDWGADGNIAAACGINRSRTYADATSTCDGAGYKVTYSYANGMIVSSTDALGETTNYQNVVGCIQPPGYSTCKIKNEWSEMQLKQTLSDGSIWQYTWGIPSVRNSDYLPTNGDNEPYVVDPLNNTTHYVFTGTTPVSMTDANGHTTNYAFDGAWGFEQTYFYPRLNVGSMLKEADYPEGNSYHAEYAGAWGALSKEIMSAKPGSGLSDQVVTYGYSCTSQVPIPGCAKPTSKVDANGHETDWLYTSFGEPYWEMQPAPSAGAARPLKLYYYGQKNAWVLDGNGNLVTSGNQIWVPASETLCQTVAGGSNATCDPSAAQVTTTYEYGPDGTADNLLLRGKVVSANGQSLRTCYRYDAAGNKIAETSPRAGLASCPS